VAVVMAAGGFGFAASMEENNAFCASCHTQPESTYFARFQAAAPADLASQHNAKAVKCIDCHSGPGTPGRISAMLEGANNAVKFYTRSYTQPAVLRGTYPNDNCLKCHQVVLTPTDMNNHWHSFLPQLQAAAPTTTVRCAACHTTHATDGDVQLMWLNQTKTEAVCQSCHNVLRGGG
jgi:predicted CXXCH cytochrome family protein